MFTNLPHTLLLLICWAELAQSQSTSVSPGEVPLVVRSPYFNSWLTTRNDDGTAANSPGGTWPTTWGGRTLSWIGSVRVDGTYYEWLGNEVNSTTQFAPTIASYITPTRTVFTVEAGPIQFNTTYLSPVEPSDWVRQSFPFGYLAIDAWSTDGQEHDVSFYSDITGSWLSNDSTDVVQWDTFKTQLTLCHSMTLVAPKPFVENNGMSEDGTMYYAMPKASDAFCYTAIASQLTWQSGSSAVLRQGFKTAGFLNNTEEKNFRAINDDFPTVAISVNLGSISETTSPLVWAIGYVRDPVIRNAKAGSSEMRRSYFWTVYKNINDAIDAFVADFPAALGRAIELDNKLMFEASNVSSQYADLVAMSLRQTFGAMDITVAELPGGGLNSTDVKVYMKDIGSSRRANPVEIIYAAFPALLYLNNTLGRLLLEPLLDLQSSPVNPNPYAAPDLGSTYPDITGNTTDQARLGVENCGSMLIMTLAHARKSGEGSLIQQYAELLKKWADYLVENSLHPDGFITADGLANPDMSNLALKGILGIYAMSIMVQVHQPQTNSTNNSSIPPYQAIAENYARQWESLAFSLDHITSSYGDNSSWGLIYNIYLSQFLKSGLISDQVLNSQASFYSSQVSSASRYGFPYDSSQNSTRSDWLLFTAATVNETGIRDAMISMVHARAFSTVSHKPWPVEYSSNDGSFITGPARYV
ncbi:hypothetical protein B0H34DRAFT_646042 [Crassisporium funariophilum]|nr:hypothetical protein B0H34DRAFT_646042 [Crassisporium funariophilum]